MNNLLEEAIGVWRDCPATLPPFGRTFTSDEQSACESELERFLYAIESEARSLPRNRTERQAARDRITSAFTDFARSALGLRDSHIDLMLAGGLSSIGTLLARQARRFDPRVSTLSIFQASRNAWTACGLQMLFGKGMSLTPSIFAYSMLYPYTDNYLDDPDTPREEKQGFGARFGRRLRGESPAPANPLESLIWRLVGLIEGQYPRESWPQVHESLMAIHRAQQNSLRLRRAAGSNGVDVLALCFEKGGASVLADGYLASGALPEEEARFVFDWGVLLQLADDLQDLREDLRDGVLTLFTEAARHEPLDGITNRTLHFGGRIMHRMRFLFPNGPPALKELIERSSLSLIVRSTGEAGEFYTGDYLAELETHSPFRFAFLNEHRRRLARRNGVLLKLFETFLAGDEDEPAFPLLPGSLMPRA